MFMESLANTFDPDALAPNVWKYPATSLIEAVCLADLLRNASNLRDSIGRALPMILPPAMVQVCRARLEKGGVPRSSTTRRGISIFDFAFARWMRTQLFKALPDGSFYVAPFSMWCDSSPMGHRNWLISHMHILHARDKRSCLQLLCAVNELIEISDTCVMEEVGVSEDDVIGESFAGSSRRKRRKMSSQHFRAQAAELSMKIAGFFSYHCILPASLGAYGG